MILGRFYIIIFCVLEFQEHLFFKAPFNVEFCVCTCNNSHTCIFNLLEKYFSFLLFILTHWLPFLYNLSHRLTELNVSFFYLMKMISSKIFNEDNHMWMYKPLN